MEAENAENARAVCVVIHGMAEHSGRYADLIRKLREEGVTVYRFDHRGHGKSGGIRAFYSSGSELAGDTEAVIDLAASENPGLPLFLVGHSMGALAAYAAASEDREGRISGIAASGGLTMDHYKIVAGVSPDRDPMEELSLGTGDGACSVDAVVNAYVRDPLNNLTVKAGLCQSLAGVLRKVQENASRIRCPVLMLHGEKDGVVSPEDTLDFFHLLTCPDKQMKFYGGAFHELFQEFCREEVMEDVLQWISRRI